MILESPTGRGKTLFLNADLEFSRTAGTQAISDELQGSTIVLNEDSNGFRALELRSSPKNIAEAVTAYCNLIEGLPAQISQQWRECQVRRINVGIQGGDSPRECEFSLDHILMLRLGKIEADIVFTIYAPA